MVASIPCFTGSFTIARGLADEVPVFVMVFFPALFGVLVMLPLLARCGLGVLRTDKSAFHGLRKLSSYGGLLITFYAETR